MKRNLIQLLLLICTVLLFLTNCEDIVDDHIVSPEDSAAAVVLLADAHAALLPLIGELLAAHPDSAQSILVDLDLSLPNGFYAEAVELDWRNQDAHFGLGFTSLLILSQNSILNEVFNSSVEIYAPFGEDGEALNPVGYGFGLPLSVSRVKGMTASYFEFPFALARLHFESLEELNAFQTQVISDFIPMVDAGLVALDSIDNDPAFIFTLGAEIQIDPTDIAAMEASLLSLQGLFKTVAAYGFELDTSDSAAIVSGLSLGSAFGTLSGEGLSLLSEAHASALASVERAEQVLDMVDAEPTELSHLFVDFSQSESPQIQTALDGLTSSLSGPTSIEYAFADERGEFTYDGTASVDISQYYLNPVADYKTLLPPYTIGTTTAYEYNQVTLDEQINFEETQVLVGGLDNTPISINIQYSESSSDTTATVSLGFIEFNLLTANQGDLPVAIWELWAEFLLTIEDYSDELHNFPEISFQWNGFITTGSSLVIDGYIAVDYLERIASYIAPDMIWAASTYGDWLSGWGNPSVNGMFPDFLAEDLAQFLGIIWE